MASHQKHSAPRQSPRLHPTRRRFLQFSAAAFSTVALSNCARNIGSQETTPESSSSESTAAGGDTLYVYTWADYANEDVFKRFTEKTGIKTVVDVYDSNETMLTKLQAGGGNQYSIIYPSDYIVQQMVESNLLTKLDPAKLKGVDNIMDRWKNPVYDANSAHSIPFNWGTTGLLYNTELIKTEPTDWNFLWDNKETLAGKLTLLDDVRETMGMVLKSLGYSLNTTDPAQLEAAYKKLLELKPAVTAFQTYGWEDQLIAGDLAMCMSYSTLGNSLPPDHPQLKYVIPKSGTSIWTDTIAIPVKAPNLEAAYAWINFVLEPENAVFAADKMKLGTPNKAAFDLLPANVKSNTNLYPTAEMIANGEGLAPVGDTLKLYDKYWTEVRGT